MLAELGVSERSGHVWSYDFVAERTHDGRPFRLLVVLDEHRRERLAITIRRKLDLLIS